MLSSLSAGARAALNIAVSLALLTVGVAGGAAAGIIAQPDSAPEAEQDALNWIAGHTPLESFAVGQLTVEESEPAPAVVQRIRRVVTQAAPGTRSRPAGGSSAGASSQGTPASSIAAAAATSLQSAVMCDRLDDDKIYWLLDLVAKTRQSNPDQAAVADHVERQLRSVLGKNLCAEEAQAYISNLCVDDAVRRFMNLMVRELPFFVRPMVGDPCTQDLVAAANRWL